MENNRIYGKPVDIDTEKVKEFYNKRAGKAQTGNPYSSVLLSDHSPELVEEQMKIDREILFPKLKIDSDSIVLDIGCGIGRWAEQIIPHCGTYYGVDFSQNMIETAKTRAAQYTAQHTTQPGSGSGGNYRFDVMSFQELVKTQPKALYNRVIISGILVYICDNDITQCLEGLKKFLDGKCLIFIWETCGIGSRLTLKDLPSEALKDTYNVIYRTKDEYDEFFKVFTGAGFKQTFCEYYSALGGTVTYTDSDKIYYILET